MIPCLVKINVFCRWLGSSAAFVGFKTHSWFLVLRDILPIIGVVANGLRVLGEKKEYLRVVQNIQ